MIIQNPMLSQKEIDANSHLLEPFTEQIVKCMDSCLQQNGTEFIQWTSEGA